VIPKIAIDEYLERSVDDHLWVKELDEDELDDALWSLEPRPNLHPDNRLHQKACFLLGVAFPRFAFWNDMGTGKTLLSLELIRYWIEVGKVRRAVVMLTSDKAVRTWTKQMQRFEIDVPHCELITGNSERNWDILESFGDGIVYVPYPSAVAMASTRTKKKDKTKLILDPKKVARFKERIDARILDESTKCGHHTSLTHKIADHLGRDAFARYALAGRPFGRDPTLLWAQQYLIDDGETLGETLGLFRSAFFSATNSFWAKKRGGHRGKYAKDFKFKEKMRPQLARMLQHRSITYGADECIDLPPYLPEVITLTLPEEAETYYQSMKKQLIAARGDFRETKNVFLRMRQTSSGFLGMKDDETGERAEIEFLQNPKLDVLMELLEQIPDTSKALIFYEFTWSGRRIVEHLKEMGEKPIWLWSGTKDSAAELKRFEETKGCRFAVVNHKVGAYSLDGLQVANYLFYYESPVSVIDREQSERRVRRQGQTKKVFQYDLVVEGTMDQRILDFHKAGEDLFKALLRSPKKVFL
jgi:hypothetical protein